MLLMVVLVSFLGGIGGWDNCAGWWLLTSSLRTSWAPLSGVRAWLVGAVGGEPAFSFCKAGARYGRVDRGWWGPVRDPSGLVWPAS